LLSSNLLEKANITKDVYVIGVGNKIEIWDMSSFDAYEKEAESHYESAAESISDGN
jgi:MraZ protein